jgi:hypothetical protein
MVERSVNNEFERRDRGLFDVLPCILLIGMRTTKKILRMRSVPAEIRTKYFRNVSPHRYGYMNFHCSCS